MKNFNFTYKHLLLAGLILFLSDKNWAQKVSAVVPVVKGVSRSLATERAGALSNIQYQLDFDIPAEKATAITAIETLSFNLKINKQLLQIDFKERTNKIKTLSVNGKEISVLHQQEHLLVEPKYLKMGKNEIKFVFTAGDLSLNRNNDFLYTLLVPDRARTVFPCFDQPDLKANFLLTLTIPKSWNAIANGTLQDSAVISNRKTYHFKNSDQISTYLFAFATGNFKSVSRNVAGFPMQFLYRETDSAKIKESVNPIFDLHGNAVKFMQQYTAIPYPFQKFGFVAIPDFQYGGMEHVGNIQYKASSLFLDDGATKDQLLGRSNVISHETAHMWFGDLVTMRWFNDVWMKEVFANFMADKITRDSSYDLKFLIEHFPAAYGVDRTEGANPIRQQLDNLQDAGTMYGNIIYHKAPIMMRQLERLMGEEQFKLGLQQYLKKYAHGNASWPELIAILDDHTPADLQSWNQVWVNEPGRPVITYQYEKKDGKISMFQIAQQAEQGKSRNWPQKFEVALVYKDHVKELTVNLNQQKTLLKKALGQPSPLFVLFNSSGQGYGVFPIDPAMLANLYTLKSSLMRASAYINLYENMLAGKVVSPQELLTVLRKGMLQEQEELNLRLLTGYISSVFWQFTLPQNRQQLAASLETELWQAMQQQKQPNNKKILLKTYQSIFLSNDARNHLYEIWKTQKAPEGIKLSEDDYTSLALSLALRDDADTTILKQQLSRIRNPDRQKRLQYLIPALSGDEKIRDAFFTTLKTKQGREKEAWVSSALGYLHHPLRQKTSEKYLAESLNLLEEIQLTGDIFFPGSWLEVTFGSYQSEAAAQTIRGFLKQHPGYNPKLKAKILQSADNAFRAEKLFRQTKGMAGNSK